MTLWTFFHPSYSFFICQVLFVFHDSLWFTAAAAEFVTLTVSFFLFCFSKKLLSVKRPRRSQAHANPSCGLRIISYLFRDLTLDCGIHRVLTWIYTAIHDCQRFPCHSDRNLGCLHSCFGSKRHVLTLALFQPLLLGQKCQLVHEKYTVGAALDAFFPPSYFTWSFSS